MPYGQRVLDRKRSESGFERAIQREEKARLDGETIRLVERNALASEQLLAQASEQRAANDAREQRLAAELREESGRTFAATARLEVARRADSGLKPGELGSWERHKPLHPRWREKGGSLDAAVYRAVSPVFRPPVGSPAWMRENPAYAAEILRGARAEVEKDRLRLWRPVPKTATGGAIGPLPPEYLRMVAKAGGLGASPDITAALFAAGKSDADFSEAYGPRYQAVERLAGGDRSRKTLADFQSPDGLVTSVEDNARRNWARDQESKPGSARHPVYLDDLLRLHPEYAAAFAPVKAARAVARHGEVPPARDVRIDPNAASQALLGTLDGFGQGKARAVIEAREQSLFQSAADFDRRVPGLGKATMEWIGPQLRFPDSPVWQPDTSAAERAWDDVLAGRPPRPLGPAPDPGVSAWDALGDALAWKYPPRMPRPPAAPALSALDAHLKPGKAPTLEEMLRGLSDDWKRAISAGVGAGPSYSLGRDLSPAGSVLSGLSAPVDSSRRAGKLESAVDEATHAVERLTRMASEAALVLERVRDRKEPVGRVPAPLEARPPMFSGRM